MRRVRTSAVLALLAVALAAGTLAAQDWRGTGRLAGKVIDDSGQPVEGVTVKARRIGSEGGTEVKTNKKGEWVLAGINGGQWQLDLEKPGYAPSHFEASVLEHGSNPPVSTTLKKAAPDPNLQISAALERAADLIRQQKFAEARAIYEDLLTKNPSAYQLEPYIAKTYYAEHQLEPAIQHLRNALAKEPNNLEVKLLLATVLAEKGDTDESRGLVASIDESKITDPATLLNVGIGLMNGKKPEEALTWFDKTVTRFPQYPDAYYYRGITELQLGKDEAAKADLKKFLELAPNAPEAATARGILSQLK